MNKKARLIKKDDIKPESRPEPKPATKPVRPAPKPTVNSRAAFDALFTKK